MIDVTVGIGFCEECSMRVFADEEYVEINGKLCCSYCNPYNVDVDSFEVREEV